MTHTALFFGAHPDDIEIGAGATVAKLVAFGWTVYFCILTTEADTEEARNRKQEALLAASSLGVPKARVFFADLPDRKLQPCSEHIGAIRNSIPPSIKSAIDVVFSHSASDTHLDHQSAHKLTPLVIRARPVLCYPIVNHMRPSRFQPQIFVDVSDCHERKMKALAQHHSQIELERILTGQIEKLCRNYGRQCDREFVEAFELEYIQPTPRKLLELAHALSCKDPVEPARKTYPWWVAGFALLGVVLSAGYYIVDFRELLHTHRGTIVLEEFRSGSHISGRIEGFAPGEYADLRVVLYVLTDKWYIHPWDSAEPGRGYAVVDEHGAWRIDTVWRDHQARRLAALLTRSSSLAPSIVRPIGNADRRILSRVEHVTALITEAPSGI